MHITKNGITANHKSRYRGKDCGRRFITHYAYRGCNLRVRALIVPMTLHDCGIRDMARVLVISPNTVVAELKTATVILPEPELPRRRCDLELLFAALHLKRL